MFGSPDAVPPTRARRELVEKLTPCDVLARAVVPEASVPMRLPRMTTFVEPAPVTSMPSHPAATARLAALPNSRMVFSISAVVIGRVVA